MIDIEAIKARLAAATPGPWRHGPETDAKVGNVVDFGPPPTAPFAVLYCADTRDARAQRLHDADLIAHAPTDIAALLAEVRRLTPTAKPPPEPKVATWTTVEGRPNMRVLVCGGREVAHYDHSGFGLWFVNVYGHGTASWATADPSGSTCPVRRPGKSSSSPPRRKGPSWPTYLASCSRRR